MCQLDKLSQEVCCLPGAEIQNLAERVPQLIKGTHCHQLLFSCGQEGRSTLLEDLERWEEWANKNLVKFNKDSCKVLHLRKHNPGVQHRSRKT